MKQKIHIKDNQNLEEISVKDLNFHPVIKDIENIFWLFLLSNKALSLPETQDILLSDNNFSEMLKKYNEWSKLKIEKNYKIPFAYTTKLNIKGQMILFGKVITILTYDFLMASKYNSIINQDSNIKFLRYIRNGAAHNNHFNMKDEDGIWKLEEKETIKWHNKKITRKLHGKKVFPDFFSIFGMFLLAKEISGRLTKIDDDNPKVMLI